MHIPHKTALLLDFSGAALFFALSVIFLASGSILFVAGSSLAFVAFCLSAWVQHNRAIGYEAGDVAFMVAVIAAASVICLMIASISWVLA